MSSGAFVKTAYAKQTGETLPKNWLENPTKYQQWANRCHRAYKQ